MVKALEIRHWLQALLALRTSRRGSCGISVYSRVGACPVSQTGLVPPSTTVSSLALFLCRRFVPKKTSAPSSSQLANGLTARSPRAFRKNPLSGRVLRRAHRVPTTEGEIRVGNQRTWWVEQVPPADGKPTSTKSSTVWSSNSPNASLVGRVRGDLLAAQSNNENSGPRLAGSCSRSPASAELGARGQYQLGPLSLEDLEKLRPETFTPANLHIAIVGPPMILPPPWRSPAANSPESPPESRWQKSLPSRHCTAISASKRICPRSPVPSSAAGGYPHREPKSLWRWGFSFPVSCESFRPARPPSIGIPPSTRSC